MTANVLLSLSPTTTSSMSLFARLSLATPTKFHGFLSLWRNSMLTSLRAPAVARKLRSCSRVAFRSASGVCATATDGAHDTVAATPNNKMLAGSEKRPFMAIPPFAGPGVVSAIADRPNQQRTCPVVAGSSTVRHAALRIQNFAVRRPVIVETLRNLVQQGGPAASPLSRG